VDVQRAAGLEATTRLLRESGLRATGPRVAVHTALSTLGGHRSADEVRAHLADSRAPLPRSSVYKVLEDLVRAGAVMTADAGPGVVLYEIGSQWHHHFVCRSCRQVFDVECVVGARPCLDAGTDVGTVDEAQVIFRGICAACSGTGA
jgi:Fe2+ or Zn2+ uptake regulation protein